MKEPTMFRSKFAAWIVIPCLIIASFCVPTASTNPAPETPVEKTIWDLERSYWQYVEANDLTSYRKLWHAEFLGWPTMSAAPVHKDRITDWITSQTSAGKSFKLVEFKPASMQAHSNVVVVYYWTTYQWLDKARQGDQHKIRVTHTWMKNGTDWQIIGGMSMAETMPTQK
jgi:hypothetical protein